MTIPTRALDPVRRLLALLVLLTAVAGVPVGLWRLGRPFLPAGWPSWAEVTAAVTGPDTGSVLLGALVVIGWVAWAGFSAAVAVEVITQLQGLPPPRLPGLGGPQQLAGLLVASVVGIGGAPLLVAPALAAPVVIAEQPVDDSPPTVAGAAPVAAAPAGPTHTVQPRDTLGRIAARYLGDWARYTEIVDLNRGRLQANGDALVDPAVIRPGWVLLLPPDATATATAPRGGAAPSVPGGAPGTVTVQPGDTLTGIAERHRLHGWRPIFDTNAGEPLPGGGRFTDPDLIRPGQVLDLPAPPVPPAPAPAPAPPAPGPPPVPDDSPATPLPPDDAPTTTPPTTDATPPTAPTEPAPTAADRSPEAGGTAPTEGSPADDLDAAGSGQDAPELAAVLAGSGALLAAGLGAAWLTRHRQRLRRRRPGRRLAPLPAELTPTHAAVTSAAETGRAHYGALDRALRDLAAAVSTDPDGRLPDIAVARLTRDRLELRLTIPADRPPPAPWTMDGTGLWWSRRLDPDRTTASSAAPTPEVPAARRLAPYPALVTVGSRDGRHWLLDLEHLGAVRISGPDGRREDFARFLAAELAVNSWSDLLTVHTVGFGAELTALAPERLSPVDDARDPRLHEATRERPGDGDQDGGQDRDVDTDEDVLHGRLHATAGTGWMPTIVLAPLTSDAAGLHPLLRALDRRSGRRPVSVVLAADEAAEPAGGDDAGDGDDAEWTITLTEDGDLRLPALGLQLPAPQLTRQQVRDIAALLAFERDTPDDAVPDAEGNRPWQQHTDAAGALREDPPPPAARPAPARDPGAPAALVEAPPADTVGTAPTPSSPGDAAPPAAATARPSPGPAAWPRRARIEADLEPLDRDLADWWDPDGLRPRLTLLGPVTLRAHGDEQAVTRSGLRRRYEETVAYLATRPHGATVDEAAAALQPARGGKTDPISARAYVHRVTAGARAWLGTDPATGHKHLSPGHRGRYTLTGVLVDADLFRQLRARAGVRGTEGLPDLLAALRLVSGPPFAQRPSGYEWLDGLDLTLTAAICDVAHQVVTDGLRRDDRDAARTASTTALLVAPDDETVLLDAVLVAYREGNRAEAETYIGRIVELHDGEDEMDLPLSTAEAINRARRRYLDRAS
jgi:nucleoid-associated protein YgaU/DNA-binding SARP family transcriptional activator